MIKFKVNQADVAADVPGDVPLLWVLREELKLTGTKFGCGRGLCGACTVHMDKQAIRSCILPIAAVEGKSITTIEGLSKRDDLHPVQTAWIKHNVPQCGYCQPGQIMAAVGLLENNSVITRDDLLNTMSGNLCRCGSYNKLREAVVEAAVAMGKLK